MIEIEKLKLKEKSWLKDKADEVFSRYVRTRDQGTCITCGIQKPISEMQAGHYVSRRHLSTRFDEWNVNCQCVSCNVFLKGNMVKYSRALMDKYGDEIIKTLDDLSKQKRQMKKADYIEIILNYLSYDKSNN